MKKQNAHGEIQYESQTHAWCCQTDSTQTKQNENK